MQGGLCVLPAGSPTANGAVMTLHVGDGERVISGAKRRSAERESASVGGADDGETSPKLCVGGSERVRGPGTKSRAVG